MNSTAPRKDKQAVARIPKASFDHLDQVAAYHGRTRASEVRYATETWLCM